MKINEKELFFLNRTSISMIIFDTILTFSLFSRLQIPINKYNLITKTVMSCTLYSL